MAKPYNVGKYSNIILKKMGTSFHIFIKFKRLNTKLSLKGFIKD